MEDVTTRTPQGGDVAGPRRSRNLYTAGFKRALDLALSILVLLVFGIPMLAIAMAIRLQSPGPALFRQTRIGKDGRPFALLKFRTMYSGNSSEIHRAHMAQIIRGEIRPEMVANKSLKLPSDARITRIGRVLRAFGLDELPQFINVLRGEMSIVGPRPPLPYEYELYTEWHMRRLEALPGITGLWQVTGHNRVSFAEMVQIDIDYINSVSLWLDLKIMALTPREMLRGNGGG